MFTIFGTETRRLPRQSRVPWDWIVTTAFIVVVVVVLAFLLISDRDTPFTGVKGQVDTAPASSQVQPAESQPAPAAPVAKEWPKAEVQWSEPFLISSLMDLPPSLPAGKGFVRETPTSVWNAVSSDEAFALAERILGKVEGPVTAGIARDPANPDIVFAGIVVNEWPHFFLSVNNEKTWNEISLIYPGRMLASFDTRVVFEGNGVVLYAEDPKFVAPMWRKATLSLKSLP